MDAAIQLLPDELEKKIGEYFKHCEKTKEVRQLKNGDIKVRMEWPSIIGLALYLGIRKDSMARYTDGDYPTAWLTAATCAGHPLKLAYTDDKGIFHGEKLSKDISAVFARARQKIEQYTLQGALAGDIEQRAASRALAQFGYRDQEAPESGSVTVKWGTVKPEDADKYSG